MKFLDCKLDLEHIKSVIKFDDLVNMKESENLVWSLLRNSNAFSSTVYLVMNILARRLPDYLIHVFEADWVNNRFGISITRDIACEGSDGLDEGDANTIQNELYHALIPGKIRFNKIEYDGYTYLHSATGGFEYDIIQWPDSQELVDNGETVIMINDSWADKMLSQPAYFVMK